MDSMRPAKRIRGAVETVRNRLSMLGVSAAGDDTNEDVQSLVENQSSVGGKRLSLSWLPNRVIVKVLPFSSYSKHERITIGFIGDKGCGKTSLIQYVLTRPMRLPLAHMS